MPKGYRIMMVFCVIIIAVEFALIVYYARQNSLDERRARELQVEINTAKKIDSVKTLNEKMIIDQLRALQRDLLAVKAEQSRENKKLRRQNEELERRFDDIGDIDRPDF